MPYVPSEKTDGKSQDRKQIDEKVEEVANIIATITTENFTLLDVYKEAFSHIAQTLVEIEHGAIAFPDSRTVSLAQTIHSVGKTYNYQGAFLGELNYAITRLIQRVPQIKVQLGHWEAKSELRYWLYAITVEALTYTAGQWLDSGLGIGGVFEDIKDEYKRRVNTSYEAAQIVKSGDCYDTPYYTRLVEVVDETGEHIGYQEIMVARSKETLNVDIIDAKIILELPKDAPVIE